MIELYIVLLVLVVVVLDAVALQIRLEPVFGEVLWMGYHLGENKLFNLSKFKSKLEETLNSVLKNGSKPMSRMRSRLV